jgi:hypothetical protein
LNIIYLVYSYQIPEKTAAQPLVKPDLNDYTATTSLRRWLMNNNSKIGGILSIISGAFGVFYLAMTVFSIYMFRAMFSQPFSPFSQYPPTPPPEFFTLMTVFYSVFGGFFALIGVLGIIGGVFSLKKRRWGLALAGAIAGTITFFPCGIPAIIFVTMAKPKFAAPPLSEPVD